jgi:hypothetical protein
MADIKDKWPWPVNVGVLGTYPEEVKALQRGGEKNLDASPLARAEPQKFLTPLRSSDNLRMGEPGVPLEVSDQITIPFTHVVIRRFLKKARRRGAILFDDAVDSEPLGDAPEERRAQMRKMLARERALLEILDRYNALAEDVYMRLLAQSKG